MGRIQNQEQKLNPARVLGIATALIVHVCALLAILVPARPNAQAMADNAPVEAVFVETFDPPPPPPPIAPPPPEVAPAPPRQRETVAPPEIILVDDCVLCETIKQPDTAPIDPDPGQPDPNDTIADSVSEARADARYGQLNRVRYPVTAIRKHEQGEVQLRVLIGVNGEPQQVELVRSSGSRALDAEAIKSVRSWRFVAAERNGVTISAWAIVPIRFNLDQA